MNKNRHLKAILVLVCLLPFAFVFITGASFLEVSEDLVIIGNGTLERDFGAQSSYDFTGQKLIETIVPVSSPHEYATSYYSSNFELVLSNNSSIFYESASELPGSKHFLSNENFDIGVYTGFYFIGEQNKSFLFESTPSLSEALLQSEAKGRSVVRSRVVNEAYYHQRTSDSRTWMEGNYTIDWSFLVLDLEFPEAGDDDWLVCP